MAITVEVDAVDRSTLVDRTTQISWERGVNGQGQASFVLADAPGGFVPDDGMEVAIKDGGTTRFEGVINGRPRSFHGPDSSNQLTFYQISVGSYEILTNKRRVRRTYTRQTFAAIVADINTTFLSGEGITLSVAAGSTHTITFNGETVSEALDILCELEADDRTWRIAIGKVLTIETITATPAPAILDATTLELDPEPTVTPDRSTYANTVTVIGGGPDFQISFTARAAAEITARAAAEPGSGIYEHDEERPEAKNAALVEAMAEGILEQRKVLRQRFTGTTTTPGFAAGQQVTVNLPNLGLLSVTMFIESVRIQANLSATEFVYTITAITGAPDGGWQSYYRREKQKPRTIPMQVEATPGLVRVESEAGPLVHDPERDPMGFFQGPASGTLDETPSAIGITHRRISGTGSGNYVVTLRRDTVPATNQQVMELLQIDSTEKPGVSASRSFSWDEFAANGNFKTGVVVDPTNTFAAIVQYGAPGTLAIVNIAGSGLHGSVASTLSAQGNIGDPVWTTDGYLYMPNVTDGKVFIYDVRNPIAPVESGSFLTSLTALFGLVASSDETWLYGVGTGGFVSLDRSNPTTLTENTALAVGDYVSCDINAADSLIGAAVRADASNVQLATVNVSGGTITLNFEGNVPLATSVMEGYGAILEDAALIVFNQHDPTGANTLKAHVFNLINPAVPTFTETLSFTHGVAGNIGPAKTAYGRKAVFTFNFNAGAQITYGVEAFDQVVPYTIGAANPGPMATRALPPRMGGSGLREGQRGNIEAWTGRAAKAVIDPPARSGATLVADYNESTLWRTEENNIYTVIELDNTDSPHNVIDGDDVLMGDTDGGAITSSLPALSLNLDRRVEFKNVGSSGNNLTVDGDGAELIDGAATLVLSDGETAILSATSVQWEVVGGSAAVVAGAIDHGALAGRADDDHTIYALLAGRATGQTLIGGTAAGEGLTLQSTAHATKGKLLFGAAGNSAYNEANDRLGIGTANPGFQLHLFDASDNTLLLLESGDTKAGFILLDPAGQAGFESIGSNLTIHTTSSLTERLRIVGTTGSVGMGTSAFGTSAAIVFAHKSGAAPGSSPADEFQSYSKDWNGAGTAAPHFRTEEGDVILLAKVATYTPTNVVTDRSYDANATTTAELADVLGTLIADLQTIGVLG